MGSWPIPKVSKSYHKINCKQQNIFLGKATKYHSWETSWWCRTFLLLGGNFSAITDFPENPALGQGATWEVPAKRRGERVETKLKGTQNNLWFWKPGTVFIGISNIGLCVFLFYLWVWIAYFDPLLFVYSCVLPLCMYFAWLIQQKQKFLICSETCLPSQTKTAHRRYLFSQKRGRHQNAWDPWRRIWQGKADAYVVISQGWASSFLSSIQRWLGGKEARLFGALPSESYISKGTRFVSSLNYKGFHTGKAKALMHLFPCTATQKSSLD